jgi:hypothetical protein
MSEPLNITEFVKKHGGKEPVLEWHPIIESGPSFDLSGLIRDMLRSSFSVTADMIKGEATTVRDDILLKNGTMIEGTARRLPLADEQEGDGS